jgi:hypothetical protein
VFLSLKGEEKNVSGKKTDKNVYFMDGVKPSKMQLN